MTKSYLQIKDKYLGTLFHTKDALGRGYLKLSFKNKIAGFVKGTDIPTTLPVLAKLTDPLTLDVSYKFEDSLLEVKKTVNGKTEREFYKIPLPVSNCLFFIRIKDWNSLDDAKTSSSPLVLTPPNQSGSVVIIFSFLGENGLPFVPPQFSIEGMHTIDVPENPLSTFCIGIGEDPNNTSANGFEIHIPFPKQ